MIFSLILNLSYASFILAYQVYQSKRVLFFEVANEVVTILTIYFLMMYAGFFITDADTRSQLGKPMIYLTIANFSVNLLPFLYDIGRTLWLKLRRFYIRRKHEQMIQQRLFEIEREKIKKQFQTKIDAANDRAQTAKNDLRTFL